MSKQAIAQNLKRLRERTGLTADEVGLKIGKSGKTVNAWENGRGQPDADILISLCQIYNVDNILAEFNSALKSQYDLSHSEQNVIKKYRQLDTYGKNTVDVVIDAELERVNAINEITDEDEDDEITPSIIKLYNDKTAAGTGYPLNDNGYEEIKVKPSRNTERADFAVIVWGDSMEPEYYDGDIVLVHSQPDVFEGQIGLFVLNGDGYIKKKGKKHLISLNKKYKDIPVSEYDNCICCGLIIGKIGKEDII